jgi:4a-hydroxytetrahydrobiopterin dehydratase
MRMKPSSAGRKPLNRARARNATLLNLLAAPGLGSLLARRWLTGAAQLLLTLVGFVIFMVWFVREMIQYYGLINGNEPLRPIGWIGATGAALVVLAWLWSAATSLNLLREASRSSLASLESMAAPAKKFDEAQILAALATVPNWKRDGATISRTFQFKDFPAAMKFVNAVADAAEAAWHHPDIDIRWNKVTLTLTTHDAGGLTDKDFALAKKFDELSAR